MSDETTTPAAAPAPTPAPAPAVVEDHPAALRNAALAFEDKPAPAADPAPAPAPAGEDWGAIAKTAREKREERERQANRQREETDAEKRANEAREKYEAKLRALEEDPLDELERSGKLKPHYEKLSERILADGKPVPLPKEEIERLAEERARKIVEETLRKRDEQSQQTAAERSAAEAQARALDAYETHVTTHGKASVLMGLAQRKRAEYAVHAANLLRDAERPITFDAVMQLSEHLAREDFPGLAQPTASAGGETHDTAASEARSDGGAPRGITAALAGQSSVSEDDDDSPAALRAAARRFAEQHAD